MYETLCSYYLTVHTVYDNCCISGITKVYFTRYKNILCFKISSQYIKISHFFSRLPTSMVLRRIPLYQVSSILLRKNRSSSRATTLNRVRRNSSRFSWISWFQRESSPPLSSATTILVITTEGISQLPNSSDQKR